MSSFQLTPHQIQFMDTFGYLHLPGLLNDRIEEIDEAFEELLRLHGSDNHDGQSRFYMVPFLNHSEYLCTLLDDERIDGIAAELLGESYQFWCSDGNYYAGNTGWHSDTAWPEPIRYYKMAFYLEPLTRDSGAVRVIPGSHKYGDEYAEALQQQVRKTEQSWSIHGHEVPAVAVETEPGDVVVFNQGTKHSSWGGGQWRRMFTLNCTCRYSREQLPLMRAEISKFSRFWVDSVYGEAMLKSAGPGRMRHLEQVLANQDHLPALTRKARAEMGEPARG